MDIAGILSILLFLPFIIEVFYRYFKNDKEPLRKTFSFFFLLIGIAFTLKIIFKVPRPTNVEDFDPYAFPSTYATLATIPVYISKDNKRKMIFYSILMILIDALRVIGGYHTVLEVISGNIIGFASLFLFDYIRNKTKNIGIDRKNIHIGLATAIGFISYLNLILGIYLSLFLILLGIILYILKDRIILIKDFLEWYSKDKSGKEAFILVIGILIPLLIGYLLNINAYYSAFYVGWLDGLSTIFGIYFKKEEREKNIYSVIGGFIGSIIAYFATNTIIFIIPFLLLIDYLYRWDDNLIIPISSFALNTLFLYI